MEDTLLMTAMSLKVRLIIPECKDWKGWQCSLCWNYDLRYEILEKAFRNFKGDLVVTSHNFFCCAPNDLIDDSDFKSYMESVFIRKWDLNLLPNKKPLVLGIDFTSPSRYRYNPFEGLDAAICVLLVKNNEFVYKTHIWEVWQGKGECNQSGFLAQRKRRVFSLNGRRICLLSCGDIADYCHAEGEYLKQLKADIIIDLSHCSLSGDTSQRKVPQKLINEGIANCVLITQQVKNVERYKKAGGILIYFPTHWGITRRLD